MGENKTISKEVRILLCVISGCIIAAFMKFVFYIQDLGLYVACPPHPHNVKPIEEVLGIPINSIIIGSCTNGRYEDLEVAAKILNGEEIHRDVRLIVTPASKRIWLEASKSGIFEILINAGAIITNPSCGACFGGQGGILAPGETCISSSNRNFQGRMGSINSKVYLGSPATVAASALKGEITDPRDF